MPTPKRGYFLADKSRVPGVTTILGRFKESGGLMHWAWQLGTEGKDYRAESRSAADSGTLAHDMIERWLRGSPDQDCRRDAVDAAIESGDMEVVPAVATKACRGFDMFLSWADQTKLSVIASEMQLVSEKHRFGGTPDAILEINGELALGDWKTSNAVYSDYLLQLAAYKLLWEEAHPEQPITGGYHLMRFSKSDADFEHRYFSDLADAEQMFLHLRSAYELDQKLKKRAR